MIVMTVFIACFLTFLLLLFVLFWFFCCHLNFYKQIFL